MKVKFKKLHEDAVLPSYAKPGDGAMDLTTVDYGSQASDDNSNLWYYAEYKTGLSCEIPDGYVGLLFPRSSISKTALSLTNSIGLIDSGYRGEICLRFRVDAGTMKQAEEVHGDIAAYKKSDRIGQLLILPYPTIEPEWADELSETERGAGAFGSSGT